jgi:hypothetical protein
LLRTWHQDPHFISLKVVEFFLHGQHPVRILQDCFYPERLNIRTLPARPRKGAAATATTKATATVEVVAAMTATTTARAAVEAAARAGATTTARAAAAAARPVPKRHWLKY